MGSVGVVGLPVAVGVKRPFGLVLRQRHADARGELVMDARVPVFGPPKSAAGLRSVAVGSVAAGALEEHRETFGEGPEGLVWFGRGNGPISRGDASDAWRVATVGVRLRPRSGWHELRHFHASALIQAGL